MPSFRITPTEHATNLLILAMLCLCVPLAWHGGFIIDPARAVLPVVGLCILAAAWAIGRHQAKPRLFAAATAFGQMTAFTLLGVVLAYVIAARAGSLWDARLAAADHALGVDWPVVLAMLDHWPAVIAVLGLAYHSLVLQMVVAIVALANAGRLATLRVMTCAAVLSGFATILVSGAIPALGNLFDPDRYHHLWPSIAWLEQGLITGLRDGSHRVLDLTALMGIVSFPSYHATLAALFLWGTRDLGRLTLPLGIVAVLTIVATPIFGGHYATDVLAGLLLARPALLIAKLFGRPFAVPSTLRFRRLQPARMLTRH